MKRFAFRLQRVATVREIERDRAHGEWAAARQREAAVEARIEGLRRAAAADAVGLVPGRPAPVADLRTAAFRAQLRTQALGLARDELVEASRERAERGEALQVAAQRVDALARLEHRARESWQEEARREEAKTLDDIVTTRAAAPRAGGIA